MAKVLACPSCGHKHSLDLLVGLDSFLCKNCDRKLAVPTQAIQTKKSVSEPVHASSRIATSDSVNVKPEAKQAKIPAEQAPSVLNQNSSEPKQEVVVVARSSMNIDSEKIIEQIKPQSDSPELEVVAKSNENDPKAVSYDNGAEKSTKPVLSKKQTFRSPSLLNKIIDSNASLMPLNTIWKIVVWLLAFPTGFFLVVIIPRMFGGGFRASYFVDVITTEGIGRYKIVLLLIVLWSLASVACYYAYTNIVQRFLRYRAALSQQSD